MSRPTFPAVTVTIEGPHDSGRTTLANLIKMHLEESGYSHVGVQDTVPLPSDDKPRFPERFDRNRALRPVNIVVKLLEGGT